MGEMRSPPPPPPPGQRENPLQVHFPPARLPPPLPRPINHLPLGKNPLRAAAQSQSPLVFLPASLRVRSWPWATTAGIMLFVWLATIQSPQSSVFVAFHYATLAAACVGATIAICNGFFHGRHVLWAAPLAVVIAWGSYGPFDQYEKERVSVERSDGKYVDVFDRSTPVPGKATRIYQDSYWRWSGKHFYRFYESYDSKGKRIYSSHGPMAGNGRLHGEWIGIEWHDSNITHEWYWYGEEITEGEWHLRNR